MPLSRRVRGGQSPGEPSREAAGSDAPGSVRGPAPGATASAAPRERGDAGEGFTSTVRDLSLAGWLRWIHANHSDATLHVRATGAPSSEAGGARDGASGTIWCSCGKIVDAQSGELDPDDAVRALLALPSAVLAIDFERVERVQRVSTPTAELLSLGERPSLSAAILDSPRGGRPRRAAFPGSLFTLLGSGAGSRAASLRAGARRWLANEYLVGGSMLAALVLGAYAIGRIVASSEASASRAPEPPRTEQATSALEPPPAPVLAAPAPARRSAEPEALEIIPFSSIEVEPPRAEIWLDGALVGVGRVQLGALRDGKLHELRFVAPNHERKVLFFRDVPPAGRVVLTRAPEQAVAAESPPQASGADGLGASVAMAPSAHGEQPAHAEGAQNGDNAPERAREVARPRPRRRVAAPAPPLARARPAEEAAPPQPAAQVEKSPHVQVIEVQTPRVQVLD